MRPPKLPLVLVPLPLLAAGCLWTSTGTSGYGSGDRAAAAEANVRAAIPAIEAYNADHPGLGYRGMTLRGLQRRYDRGVTNVRIPWATRTSYCVTSTVGPETYHKAGPAGDILPGSCPARP
ncbi:MAG TPA: hypothetical protein VGJ27_04280 [Gaiellaceae bacterium]|jgi:hypothetical protein